MAKVTNTTPTEEVMTTSLDETEAPVVDETVVPEEPTKEPIEESTEEPTEGLTTDVKELKAKGFITTVVGPESLTKENLSQYVTQVGVASKLIDQL